MDFMGFKKCSARRPQTVFLTVLFSLGMTACKPPTPNDIGAKVTSSALKVGPNTLEIETDPALEADTLSLEGNMNMTGHDSPTGVAKRVSAGKYRAQGFDFNMAGDWVLSIQAKVNGKVKKADVPVLVN